jgi:hypothetical protein
MSMKRTFGSGLVIGGLIGASTAMFALALCVGSKLVMGLGAVAIVAGLAATVSIVRLSTPRG